MSAGQQKDRRATAVKLQLRSRRHSLSRWLWLIEIFEPEPCCKQCIDIRREGTVVFEHAMNEPLRASFSFFVVAI
jgi:hypothetical protein